MRQDTVQWHAIVDLEQSHHLANVDLVIGRMGGYLLKEDVVDVDQQLALQFELLPILHVVVLKLLLLVCLGGPADLGVAVLDVGFLFALFACRIYHGIVIIVYFYDGRHRRSNMRAGRRYHFGRKEGLL